MRRESASRHRASFLVQLGPRLAEIAALAGDGGDDAAAEAVGSELARLADTADRLGLEPIASGLRAAAIALDGGGWQSALRAVAASAAEEATASPVGPIFAIVASDEVERVEHLAGCSCQQVRVFGDPASAAAALEVPVAVLAPGADAGLVARWARAGVPVFAFGEGTAEERSAALAAGASAWLPGALDLEGALELVRWTAWQASERPVVAVLGSTPGIARALVARGLRAVPADAAPERWSPDGALALDPRAAASLPALRAHATWARTAVLAVSDAPVAGADAVAPPGLPPDELVARLAPWLARVRAVPVARDPLTGLANRPAALRAIDRWVAWGRRTATPLTVGLVALDGFETGDDSGEEAGSTGLAAEAHAQRTVAAALLAGVRRLDVVGRLAPGLFVVGLPGCSAEEARKRLGRAFEGLAAALAVAPRAKGWAPVLGVADTAHAPDRLLARAWEDLASVRQGV